jgi:hypothetical protein
MPITISTLRRRACQRRTAFGAPGVLNYPIKITAWNDVTVAFLGFPRTHRIDHQR